MKGIFERLANGYSIRIRGHVKSIIAEKRESKSLWLMTIKFDAWRLGTSSTSNLQTEPLTVIREVSDEEYNELESKIKTDSIIKIQAWVDQEDIYGSNPVALFDELIEPDFADYAITEYLHALEMPAVHEDEVLGTFTYDRLLVKYTANLIWNGENIDLNLNVESIEENLDTIIQVAHTLWENQKIWESRIRDYAVKQLLPVKNESWLEKGEIEVTEEQFKNKMKLGSISVEPDGTFSFCYNDGDLFWGHQISVYGNLSEGPTDCDI